ncbi:MAG: sulfite exporter TauE/SafE family protein [SAR324 cluster bacterium]|nr:sulfite exporter TauE/SafE family protein [SAR324 cluster bacterium]
MSSIEALVWVFFVSGLTVGFGHCIGMCGPIVVSFSLKSKTANGTWLHALYHAGRLTTYSLLGGIMGISGSFTMVTSRLADIQKGVLIFAGALIIFMGMRMGGWMVTVPFFNSRVGGQLFLTKTFGRLTRSKSVLTYYPLGLLLGLMPCGAIYTVLIASARAGMEAPSILTGFLKGTALMTAFGLGTVPALLTLGKLAGLKWFKKRALIYKAGALLMVGMGIYFVVKGIRY